MSAPFHPDAPPDKIEKYALRERERRFLLARVPDLPVVRTAAITDRYLDGTRMRLRRMVETLPGATRTYYKLTQKVPAVGGGQGLLTTFYLSREEHEVLERVPGRELRKERRSAPPFAVDVFAGELEGLVMAEAELETDEEFAALPTPDFALADVTADARFTGGSLAVLDASALSSLLSGYR